MFKQVIYQLFVRLFGNKKENLIKNGSIEENGVGKFEDINEAALREIKKLGVSHVWYTGVLCHSTTTDYSNYGLSADPQSIVKGKAGSPYAVKDFFDVDPDLAENPLKRIWEFERLIARTHRNELKVIIDFIPNHVARTYKGLDRSGKVLGSSDKKDQYDIDNAFYYINGESLEIPDGKEVDYQEFPAKASGNDSFTAKPSANDWYDTVKLNYGVNHHTGEKEYLEKIPAIWFEMREVLLFWAGKGVDGFRCDMVEMIPIEFWKWVIEEVKSLFPNIQFIGEAYAISNYHDLINQAKFDLIYDKTGWYDSMRDILLGKKELTSLRGIMQSLKGLENNLLHFLENHDEVRLASKEFLGDSVAAIPAMVAMCTLPDSHIMVYGGQELGESASGESGYSSDDGRTTIFDYWNVPSIQRWMGKGYFNGNKLSEKEKKLRILYKKLLRRVVTGSQVSSVITGDTLFLDEYSDNVTNGFDKTKVLCYLKYKKKKYGSYTYLIACNFDRSKSQLFSLRIPVIFWNAQEAQEKKQLQFIQQFPSVEKTLVLSKEQVIKFGIPLNLNPSSAIIYKIAS